MNFKTPLFLIFIVGSLWLIIFAIWPDFKQISVKKQELQATQAAADSIKEKNANMASLVASLNASQNLEARDFAFNYIPKEKKEEVIFNSLSAIANSEGVAVTLSNASVENKAETVALAVAPEAPQSSQAVLFGSEMSVDGVMVPTSVLPTEKTIRAKMSISGKYENIKKFIEKLYSLNMRTDISDMRLASTMDQEGGATGVLLADITADFTYLPEAKINNDYNSPVFGVKSFDFAIVTQVSEMLSQKFSAVTVEKSERNNPFLP